MKTTAAFRTVDSESLPVQQDGAKLRRRFQIGLRDVAVWVVGAAVISYFARWWVARWRGDSLVYVYLVANLSYIHPLLGLSVMILGMLIAFRLVGQAVGLARSSIDFAATGFAMSPRVRAAAIFWRLVAALTVAAVMAEVVAGLNPPGSVVYRNKWITPRNSAWDVVLPLFGLVVIVGTLLGMRPAGARTRGSARSAWFSTILAGAFCVGYLAGLMVVPHLVLVAMEAMSIAQRPAVPIAFGRGEVPIAVSLDALPDAQRPPAKRVSLAKRLDEAGLSGGLALVTALATAVWIGRDLRQAASDVADKPLSRWRLFYRIATITAMVAATTYVLRTTIPRIHPSLSAGIWMLLGPEELGVVLVAIASLSAGVVARAIGRRNESIAAEQPSRSGTGQRLGRAAVCLALSATIYVALVRASRTLGNDWMLGPWWGRIAHAVTVVLSLWDLLWSPPLPLAFWVPALAWAIWETVRLCGPWAPDRLTAFDAAVLSWSNAGRFLCFWSALSVLCVCALPAIFVAALAVYHIRLVRLH
ncbi:MAG: hypothetical protein ACLQVF_23475 [Isosphaeraceae bacterium]